MLDLASKIQQPIKYGYEFSWLFWLIINIFHKSCFYFFSTIWVWKFRETHVVSCPIIKNIFCWSLGFSRIYHWSSWSSQDYILFLKFCETNVVKIEYFLLFFRYFTNLLLIFVIVSWTKETKWKCRIEDDLLYTTLQL